MATSTTSTTDGLYHTRGWRVSAVFVGDPMGTAPREVKAVRNRSGLYNGRWVVRSGLIRAQFCDRHSEAIALLGYRFNIWTAIRGFAELFSQRRYVDGKIRLFHKAVGPNLTHQLFFGGQPITVPDQDQKNFKRPWG